MPEFNGIVQEFTEKSFKINGTTYTVPKTKHALLAKMGNVVATGNHVHGKFYTKSFDDGNTFNFVTEINSGADPQLSVPATGQPTPASGGVPSRSSGSGRETMFRQLFLMLLESNIQHQGIDFLTAIEDPSTSHTVVKPVATAACDIIDAAAAVYKARYGGGQ